ncbi:dipeptide epimerase [Burkholderia cepacia]|uniref:dipeptide epimerase n=1 Tax=Burkholderia cepacia TaxID=292 RepID=UPI001CF2C2AB|nr:dipeptide epimerase [Burkholderia cepacia]MCA8279928.1 dipeptide epimerase [Burkholderia cepacia]
MQRKLSTLSGHINLTTMVERWDLKIPFVTARGSRTEVEVIVVEIAADGHTGRGEATPSRSLGESASSCLGEIAKAFGTGVLTATDVGRRVAMMPSGAARSALDSAIWDLAAKHCGTRAWTMASMQTPTTRKTIQTISAGPPDEMVSQALMFGSAEVLKLKLNGRDDDRKVRAVRLALPNARLIVDANESWTMNQLATWSVTMRELGVELIEQPLPAGSDTALSHFNRIVPICADESFTDPNDLSAIASRYDFVNIKLDKLGGLSSALVAATIAESHGLGIMLGCMIGTSLGMAPSTMLFERATYIDVDGPSFLASDREPTLWCDGVVSAPRPALWG